MFSVPVKRIVPLAMARSCLSQEANVNWGGDGLMRVRGLSVWVFALVGAGRGGRSRTVAAVLCACVCALGACLALATAPSLAASGGGGTFGPLTASDFSAVTPAVSPGGDLAFGSEGEGAGQLDKPHGVAVDRSTGDVYVADKANDRVDEFEEDGTFVRTWGWGVVDGKSEFEVCTSSCRAGPEEAQGAGAMFRPVGIAIDQATGDVYVIDLENDRCAGVYRERCVCDDVGRESR